MGSRKLRLPDFLTMTMVVGCQPHATAAFAPRNIPGTPGPWFGRKENMSLKNPVTPPGIDPETIR